MHFFRFIVTGINIFLSFPLWSDPKEWLCGVAQSLVLYGRELQSLPGLSIEISSFVFFFLWFTFPFYPTPNGQRNEETKDEGVERDASVPSPSLCSLDKNYMTLRRFQWKDLKDEERALP